MTDRRPDPGTEPDLATSEVAADAVGPSDGRVQRRLRNEAVVLDAVVTLFERGSYRPRPEEVAERAGISPRSVYRYFDDPEAMYRAAMARRAERVDHLFDLAPPEPGAPLAERVDRFVAARLRLHDEIAAVARAARLAAPTVPAVAERIATMSERLRGQIAVQFAAELADQSPAERRATVAAIDALTQLEGLDHYLVHRDLRPGPTATLLAAAVAALLAPRD